LREKEKLLKEHNVQVVVVTFEAGCFAKQYVQETGIDWPLLIDEKRELYAAYGILEASFWDIWGPKTWWAYFKELLAGHLPRSSAGDISQRGGDVLIDPDGIARVHHIGSGPADRPSIENILAHMQP
jgi:hypothetical protein